MSDLNLSINQLEADLGIDDPMQELAFPAPIELQDSPPGEDDIGQTIIDGSKPDDFVEIPGLEDEYIVELCTPIELDDVDTIDAVEQDIEEANALVADAETIVERLEAIEGEIKENGAIRRSDLERAIETYPGLEHYIPPLNTFSESLTLTGYDVGLNGMDKAKNMLKGGILLGIIAVIYKAVSFINRIRNSKANLRAIHAVKETPSPSSLSDKYQKYLTEASSKIRAASSPLELSTALAERITKEYPDVKVTPNDIQRNVGLIVDVIFFERVKSHYTPAYELLLGKEYKNLKPTELNEALAKLPKGITIAMDELKSNIDKAIHDFPSEKVFNSTQFFIGKDEFIKLGLMGGVGHSSAPTIKRMASTHEFSDGVKKVDTVAKWVNSEVNLSASVKMDIETKSTVEYVLGKRQELERIVQSIQDSKNADRIENRKWILNTINKEIALIQENMAAVMSLRVAVTRAIGDIDEAIKKASTIVHTTKFNKPKPSE